jgi:drug/metabolite transporter (DMT)-like permease
VNRYGPWATFLLLSLIWGSSFLFIKVAVQEIGPLLLVGFRLFLGLLLLLPLALVQRRRLPRDPRTWADLVFIAVVGVAAPFALISWGRSELTAVWLAS